MSTSLAITGESLTPELVFLIASDPAIQVGLDPQAAKKVTASRDVVESVLSSGQTVYGVNTGFGALSHKRIPPEALADLQANLVRSHAVGTGPLLEEPVVRAMMLLRANTLAKGFSGVRPVVIETLLALLNAGVHPIIPSKGSLGASGDLAPLAHLALSLIGEGEVMYLGDRMHSQEALELTGITPLTLSAKEGLALLNGTQMMTAVGTLTLLKAEHLMAIAELAGCMSIEALRGSHAPFDVRVASARPHPGHQASAHIARKLLAHSEIESSHHDCGKVQDAYSMRCIPQVHGMVRDTLAHVREVLTLEMNAATDNPLVFPASPEGPAAILSQGNFHGEPVAMAMDMLSIALAELASISERRIDKLMNPAFSELPPFLVPDNREGLHSGLMIVHYTAASLVSENKTLAHPAVVDSIPTSNDKEDHVSMGAFAARKAEQVYQNSRWVIAAELYSAVQGLGFHHGVKPGIGVHAAYQYLRNFIPPVDQDRVMAPEIERVVTCIENHGLYQAVCTQVGSF
ncbi:MAG: histidine ammonia-lyase [Cyanobacteria bacterium]|nr:histidine ammonia-lyase [Cyanobacteriota bacterium]